ncbi:MAG TPA: helix-turn-helix transcriptional regulator [Rhodanobacter sp.]
MTTELSSLPPPAGSDPEPNPHETFADRIKLLIKRVGSVTEIARMCGFSEGVVRSWRDGNTDPSRARCVTLSRALGVSLAWLVAGEGNPQLDLSRVRAESQTTAQDHFPLRERTNLRANARGAHTFDSQRLASAVQILQSELDVAHGHLSVSSQAELLTELYEILGPQGNQVAPQALIAFNRHLVDRLHEEQVQATA